MKGKWRPRCPLLQERKGRARLCPGARCAWWLEDPGECVVARIVPALALVLARVVNKKEE